MGIKNKTEVKSEAYCYSTLHVKHGVYCTTSPCAPFSMGESILVYGVPRELLRDNYLQVIQKHLALQSRNAEVLTLFHKKFSKLKGWRKEDHFSSQENSHFAYSI